ncbi:MAG: hypothetical protein ACRCXM_08975 [Beijerinckiaceae bacterium]
MVANTAPIFPLVPDIEFAPVITAANTTKDGSAGTVTLVFTAGADGAYISHIVGLPYGTNIASLARVFINNGGVSTTPANNSYFDQIGLPPTTLSETAEMRKVVLPMGISLPPNHRIYMTIATTVAAGWQFTAVAGSYS